VLNAPTIDPAFADNRAHNALLAEIRRVLKPDGRLNIMHNKGLGEASPLESALIQAHFQPDKQASEKLKRKYAKRNSRIAAPNPTPGLSARFPDAAF